MTFEELETEHKAVENLPLDQCTNDQLRIKLAYDMRIDGADWSVVCEMHNDITLTRDFMIRTLKLFVGVQSLKL